MQEVLPGTHLLHDRTLGPRARGHGRVCFTRISCPTEIFQGLSFQGFSRFKGNSSLKYNIVTAPNSETHFYGDRIDSFWKENTLEPSAFY